jgi:hypothetical protein
VLGITPGGLFGDLSTAAQFLQSASQFCTVPDDVFLHLGDTFSTDFWWKFFPGGGSTRGLMNKGPGGFEIRETAGRMQLLKNGVGIIAQSFSVITTGKWFHITITKNGSSIHIYINGIRSDRPCNHQ